MTRMRIPRPPIKPPPSSATSRDLAGPEWPRWDHAPDRPAKDAEHAEDTQQPSPPQRQPVPGGDRLWFTKFRKRWDDPILAEATDAVSAEEPAAHDATRPSAAMLREDTGPGWARWDAAPERVAEDTSKPWPPPQRQPVPGDDRLWFTKFRKRWDDPIPAELAEATDAEPAEEPAAHDAAPASAATLREDAGPGWTRWDDAPDRAAEDTPKPWPPPQRQVSGGDRLWFTKFRKRWDDPMPAEPSSAGEPMAPARSEPSPAGAVLPPGATPSELPHRAEMEQAFGASLGHVQAYTGRSGELAPYGARALSAGDVVMFAEPQPSPAIVAHEVTHALQNQRVGAAAPMAFGVVAPRDSAAEAEADANARLVATHGARVRLPPITAAPAAHIHLAPSAPALEDTHAASDPRLRPRDAGGPSATPAPPRPSVTSRSRDIQGSNPIDDRWYQWDDRFTAQAEQAAPGASRALALRVQLLFESGPEQPFLRIEDVDAFAAACRTTGADEHATLAQLARVSDAADTLLDHGAAFPQTWAENVAKLASGADHAALFRVMETAKVGALDLAHSIRDDVWNRGLPLSPDEAMQLTAGNLLGRTLSLAHARDPSDEITARFARAALRWELAISHFYLVQFYDWELDHRIQEIRSGELVIDQAELSSLRSKHQALQAWLARLQKAEATHNTGETLQTLMLRHPTRFHRVTGVSDYQFSWSTETAGAFRAEIDQVDRQIAASNQVATIWRAARWASERGYNGAAAREVWEAMKDDAVTSIATLLGIVLLQAIPGVDVAVDLVLLMEFGGDILHTAAELGETLRVAGAARTTVDLQQAAIRMARSLVGSAAKLALFAVTWGAGKAAGKIARWRRGQQFVERNSTTPETAAEARKALADAKGDVETAEKLLRQRQEHVRQRRELARAEQERLKAEVEAKEAEADREAPDERAAVDKAAADKAAADKAAADKAAADKAAADKAANEAQHVGKSAAGNAETNATKKYIFDASEKPAIEKKTRAAAFEAAEKAYKDAIAAGGTPAQANTAANKAAKSTAETIAKEEGERSATDAAARAIHQGGAFKLDVADAKTQSQLSQYISGITGRAAKRLARELDGLTEKEFLDKMSTEPCSLKMINFKGPPAQVMRVYEYPDGTVVRHKPLGDQYRNGPAYSIEIKRDPALPDVNRDSSAFKVDPSGNPLPKGPFDVKNPYPPGGLQADVFERAIMNAGHRPLR